MSQLCNYNPQKEAFKKCVVEHIFLQPAFDDKGTICSSLPHCLSFFIKIVQKHTNNTVKGSFDWCLECAAYNIWETKNLDFREMDKGQGKTEKWTCPGH